jgi:hypothetical protein
MNELKAWHKKVYEVCFIGICDLKNMEVIKMILLTK